MLSLVASCDKANIFLGLIEFELNSLLGGSTVYQFIFDSTLKDICKICDTTFHQLTSVAHFLSNHLSLKVICYMYFTISI